MRRALRAWHARLGLTLGLLLFIISATGTLAVISRDIDAVLDPARRVDTSSRTMNWAAVSTSLAQEPPRTSIEFVAAPTEPGRPATAMIVTPRGQRQVLLFHPETGALRGRRHLVSVQVFFRQLHKSLLIPKGLYVVTFFGVLLLFSIVSGLLIGRGWWRKMRQIRVRGVSAPLRWGDLHRALGAWSVPFGLVIATTSVWYLAEASARGLADASVETPAPHLDDERLAELPQMASLASLASYVEGAEAALPELDVKMVVFPFGPEDVARVDGQTGAWLVRDRASRVYLDPYDASVVGKQIASSLAVGERWSHTADPLHFGSFGGLAVRLVWMLLGAVMSFVVLAGTVLWFVRERARYQKAQRTGRSRRGGRWLDHLPAVAVGVVLAVATSAAALAPSNSILRGTGVPTRASEETPLGPWRVVVTEEGDGQTSRGLAVLPLGHGVPLWRDLKLSTDGGTTWKEARDGFRQEEHWMQAADEVRLRATTPGGQQVAATARLFPLDSAQVAALGLDETPLSIRASVLAVVVLCLVALWVTAIGWSLLLRRPGRGLLASLPVNSRERT